MLVYGEHLIALTQAGPQNQFSFGAEVKVNSAIRREGRRRQRSFVLRDVAGMLSTRFLATSCSLADWIGKGLRRVRGF